MVSTQHCRLRLLTFFPVVAALSACFGRCDWLGVQDADGRLWVAIQRVSRQLTQRIIDFDQCSIAIPFVEIVPNGTHWRNVRRKHAPLAAGAIFVEQCVDDRAAINVGRTAAFWRRGDDQRRDSGLLRIGQIGHILHCRESTLGFWHTILLCIRKPCSASWHHKPGFLITLLGRYSVARCCPHVCSISCLRSRCESATLCA